MQEKKEDFGLSSLLREAGLPPEPGMIPGGSFDLLIMPTERLFSGLVWGTVYGRVLAVHVTTVDIDSTLTLTVDVALGREFRLVSMSKKLLKLWSLDVRKSAGFGRRVSGVYANLMRFTPKP